MAKKVKHRFFATQGDIKRITRESENGMSRYRMTGLGESPSEQGFGSLRISDKKTLQQVQEQAARIKALGEEITKRDRDKVGLNGLDKTSLRGAELQAARTAYSKRVPTLVRRGMTGGNEVYLLNAYNKGGENLRVNNDGTISVVKNAATDKLRNAAFGMSAG